MRTRGEEFNPVAALIAADTRTAPADKMDKLRDAVRRERDAGDDVKEAEERLKEAKKKHFDLAHRELPDLFEQSGVDSVTISAEGNHPAFEGTLKPYYNANIAADWPDAKREAGFKALQALEGGDLVKTIISIEFGRGEAEEAEKLTATLREMGVTYSSRQGVPWTSLTAFVKELIESGDEGLRAKVIGSLDALGATVGKIVKLKERK